MDTTPELIEIPPTECIGIRARVPLSELAAFFGGAFGELAACADGFAAGPPFALYHAFEGNEVELTAAFPVRSAVPVRGRVARISLPGGPAVRIEHRGGYQEMVGTYGAIDRWLDQHARRRSGPPREIYLTPPTAAPADQVTLLVQPLA